MKSGRRAKFSRDDILSGMVIEVFDLPFDAIGEDTSLCGYTLMLVLISCLSFDEREFWGCSQP